MVDIQTLLKPNASRPKEIEYPLHCQIKYDGFATYVFVVNGEVSYFTSGKKEMKLSRYPFMFGPDGVYFCEMIGTNGKMGDRQNCGLQTTYRVNTEKGIPNDNDPSKWRIFDYVSIEDWVKGHSTLDYRLRMKQIELYFDDLYLPKITTVHSDEQLNELLMKTKQFNWEGLVAHQEGRKWRGDGKRYKTFFKLKIAETYDLRVESVEPGRGRLVGLVGALNLTDSAGRHVGTVGTGLSDSDRTIDYVGKVVEVKCERISKAGILIQPVFVAIREEKPLDLIKL